VRLRAAGRQVAVPVTAATLGSPAQFRDRIAARLPSYEGYAATVKITARTAEDKRCAAWSAAYYEAQAWYPSHSLDPLGPLEDALRAGGAYVTTQVHASLTAATTFTSPDWPSRLGVRRRDRDLLRSQVIALFRDQPSQEERHSAGEADRAALRDTARGTRSAS